MMQRSSATKAVGGGVLRWRAGRVLLAGRPRSERERSAWWWVGVAMCCLVGLVLRAWNLDFDQRQHLHPDERHWSMTSAAFERERAPAEHGTIAGPLLDWLDGERSPANPYRVTDSFVYGPATLAVSRGVAGWLHDGAVEGDQPAAFVVDAIDALGVPLLDDAGAPRFDAGYNVDLVGRLLGALADTATIAVAALIGRRVGGRRVGLAAAFLYGGLVLAIQHTHFFGSEPVLALASALTVLATLRIDRGPDVARAGRTGLVAGVAAGATLAAKMTGAGLVLVPFALCAVLAFRNRRRADVVRLAALAAGTFVAFRVLCPAAFNGLGLLPNRDFWDDLRAQREYGATDLPPNMQWAGRLPVYEGTRWLVEFTIGPGGFVAAVLGAVMLVRRQRRLGRWPPLVLVGALVVPWAFVVRDDVTSGRYFVPMLPALAVCGGYSLAALWRLRQTAVFAVLSGLAALWPLAFVAGVYGHEHTRVEASHWIAEHVEAGSVLSVEAWDDGLPLAIEGVDQLRYEYEQLELWGTDDVAKVERLAEQLERIDYVVESSPRVWNVVTRLPGRFPSTMRFFEALDDGSLGFVRVATFESPPRLGPLRLDTTDAEEAFSVYDHPEVRIWRNVENQPADELFAELDPLAAANALPIHPDAVSANGAMLTEAERAENETVGTFAETFDTSNNGAGNGLLHALGWLVVIEFVGWSAFVLLLPVLRQLPDAGAGLSKAAGMVLMTFAVFAAVTWLGVALSRGIVIGVVALWVIGGAVAAWLRRAQLAELWSTRRRELVQAEVLSLVGFVALVLLRAANPDLWHSSRSGEKPFELAMFTSVLRSRTLPPYDTWFAGGALNYYYGGYLLLSIPARILRTAPALAMNLAMGCIGSLSAGAVYSAGAAVLGGGRGDPRVWAVPRSRGRSRARRAGLLAVLFVLLLPNLAIVPRAVLRLVGQEHGPIDWWALSRVIPDSMAVTEFPAWALLFADVHPHVIDVAVLATLIAVAIAWYGALREGSPWPAVALAAVTGVFAGAVRAINTWDFPLAMLLVAAPLVAAVLQARQRWRTVAVSALIAAGVVVVGWSPYVERGEVTDAGVDVNERHTPLASWAWQFGFFAVATLVGVALVVPAAGRAVRTLPHRTGWLVGTGALVAVTAGALVVEPDYTVLVLSGAFAAVSVAASLRSRVRIPLLAAAAGWAIVAAVEVVSVVNDTDRMNTVFKGWFQAWLLLALAAAGIVATLVRVAEPRWRRVAGATLVVGALLMTTAFVQLATPPRLDERTSPGALTLDGLAFFADAQEIIDPDDAGGAQPFVPGDDLPLIRWLQENVGGIVTVAEAPGYDYTWRGRIAAFTGLPTVIGWPYHETQQRRRYGTVVDDREAAMRSLYASGDPEQLAAVLQRFDIRYVVFGTVERVVAGEHGREALIEFPCLDVQFRDGEFFVAAVDQRCVAEQPGALPVRDGVTPG